MDLDRNFFLTLNPGEHEKLEKFTPESSMKKMPFPGKHQFIFPPDGKDCRIY